MTDANRNDAEDSYAVLLIKDDPTGQAKVIFERVQDLNPDEYRRYQAAYKVLLDILVSNLFAYVRQSSLDFMQTVLDASVAFRDGKISYTRPDDTVLWGTRLRTNVLSVCSSIHHHQDQSYIAVIKKFGKDSDQHVAMKSEFANIYDNNFGYRYLYKMRNTMVHFTMMTASMNASAEMRNGEKAGFVDMRMDRSALLEQKDHLNRKLRDELLALSEDPSVHEMVNEALPELRLTNRRVLEILYPEIESYCKTVTEFDALFEGRSGVRGLIHQQSPELRPPFTTGYSAWATQVFLYAYARTGQEPPAN